MPLIYVQRYGAGAAVAGDGTQYIVGDLTLSGKTIIELDPSVFNSPKTYVVFQYGGSFNYDTGTYATAQDALNALLTMDGTGCRNGTTGAALTVVDTHGTIDTGAKQITVTLA